MPKETIAEGTRGREGFEGLPDNRDEYEEVVGRLRVLVSAEQVDRLRKETGYNPRQRVATAYRVLLVCVEGCLSGQTLGFATLRAFFIKRFGMIRPRAFQLRFKSAKAVAFFRGAFEQLVAGVVQEFAPSLRGTLGGFEDVLVYDGSSQRVPKRGRKQGLKATTHTAGGSKWVIGYSLKHGVAFEACGGSGCASEIGTFTALVGALTPKVLYLLDLAYFSKALYREARATGAHLLLRLKASDKLREILWVRRAVEPEGREAPRCNQNVPTYLKRAARLGLKEVDMDVRWGDGKASVELRVVGVYLDTQWRLYLTTVSREQLTPWQIATTYRLRWLIEFLFREWKQQLDWGRSATADRHALFALTYAALFAHALVRSLRIAAALRHDEVTGQVLHLTWRTK